MIVVDASVVVDLLVGGPASPVIRARVKRARTLAAPHLLDAEVAQVLRRLERNKLISDSEAAAALVDLDALPLTRYGHAACLPRAFILRRNATIYDALYIVLAETLRVPLYTRDAALSKVPGHFANVEVV